MEVRASSTQERQQEVEGADRRCEGSRTVVVVEETVRRSRIVRTWTRESDPQEEERSRSRSSHCWSWSFVVGLRPRTTTSSPSRSLLVFHPRSSSRPSHRRPRSPSLLFLPTPRFLPLPSPSATAAAAKATLLPTATSAAAAAAADLLSIPLLPELQRSAFVRRRTLVRRRSSGSGSTAHLRRVLELDGDAGKRWEGARWGAAAVEGVESLSSRVFVFLSCSLCLFGLLP